jgi:hypothetical protein
MTQHATAGCLRARGLVCKRYAARTVDKTLSGPLGRVVLAQSVSGTLMTIRKRGQCSID